MNATVSAVYEQGALHLVQPLKLPERSQVWVQVLSDHTDEQEISFKRYLATVRRLMVSLEQNWSSHLVRQLFPKLLQDDLRTLSRLAQPPQSELCSMLFLAVTHICTDKITKEQMAAIYFALDLLEQETLTNADLDACDECLTALDLPASFALDAETVQSYLEEQ